jgi:hypothetical protein
MLSQTAGLPAMRNGEKICHSRESRRKRASVE